MKGKVFASILIAALLTLMLVFPGFAQGPSGVWTSWPFLQNLESVTTTCSIDFYAEDATTTTPIYSIPSFQIPGGGSKLVPVYDISQLGTTFSGSMVVSCDGRVAAVTNVVNSQGAGSSYVGADVGSNAVSIPSVHADDWGWFTEISVQNTDLTQDAVVTVAFKATQGQNYTPPSVTVKPGAVHRFKTYDFRSSMDNVSGVAGFVGSASITSTGGKVVAVAREWNSGSGVMTLTYNGIPSTDGGTVVYFPSQHNNNFGWYTWNFVFNSSGSQQTVSIQFTGKTAVTANIPANGSITIATQDYLGATDYVGALTVSCTTCGGNKYLSGMANEVNGTTKGSLSYNGFYQGPTGILFPSQHNNDWGWNAYNFVQNLSGEIANVRVEWIASADSPKPAPAAFNTTIPANGKLELHTYLYHGANDFIGALKVTSTNGKFIVGICNEVNGNASGFDASISYNSLPQ